MKGEVMEVKGRLSATRVAILSALMTAVVALLLCATPQSAWAVDYSDSDSITSAKSTYGQNDNENFWYAGLDVTSDQVYAYLTENESSSDTYTLNIVGSGEMADYSLNQVSGRYYSTAPWETALTADSTTGLLPITQINLGDSVTSIGNTAFASLAITEVTFSSNVTSYGTYVFIDCSAVTTVDWSGWNTSLTTIPEGLLFRHTSLTTSIVDGTTYTNGELHLPSCVTSVGTSAFISCTSLTSCDLSNVTEGVGINSFSGASSLVSVTLPETVAEGCESTYFKNGCFGSTALTSINLPSNVTAIPAQMFYNCGSLKSIDLESVTSIGKSAFQGSAIASVTGDSVETIVEYAFQGSQLTEANFPKVTEIQNNAFDGTSTLTSANLPVVQTVGTVAFRNCTNLKEVKTGSALATVGDSAFSGCSSLISGIDLSGVTSIGSSAFSGCSSLTTVVSPTSKLTSLGTAAFSGCSALTTTMDLSGLTTIPGNAFSSCSSLTEVVLNPETTSIGTHAFYNCKALSGFLYLPAVTTVEYAAFTVCENLSGIYLPALETITANSSGDRNSFSGSSVVIYVANDTQATLVKSAWGSPASNVAILNDGSFALATTAESGSFAEPTREGYAFGGWYASSDFTGEAATTPAGSGTTYYAKWSEAVASVAVGGTTTNYATLQEAMAAAGSATGTSSESPAVVTALSDITLTATVNFTVDSTN